MVLLGVEGGSIDAFFLSCHPIASISWFHLGILLCWNLFFNFFQIFHFIQLERFHASIGGSFMTFFFWFYSPPNCNNFTVPFGVHGCLLFSHFPHLAQLQQFHGSVRDFSVDDFFFFPPFFHSPFHPLATISMGILWKEKNKS
jgi:hypothetical protein